MSGNLSIGQRALKVKSTSRGLESTPRAQAKYQFKFTKVPNSLLVRPRGGKAISDGANLTLQQILGRDFEDGNGQRKGYVLASVGELAGARRRCTRTIRNHLKELLEKGFVSRIEGRRIYINYRRLGDLRGDFTIIPNRLLELDLPDGVILTLECLVKEGSLKLDRRAGLATERALGDGAQVNRGKLAEERGKSSRTIGRHLSRLKAFDWQEADVHGKGRARTLISVPAQNDVLFRYMLSAWLGVENYVALWGKKWRLWWKNLSAPSGSGKGNGDGDSRTSPSPHNTKTKTKINTNDDITWCQVRRPELRRFLGSPQESRRRVLLIKRFGEEAFVRALRQADLQYARSPTKIRNPYGLLWTMLQNLDDTLLRAQEVRERKGEEQRRRPAIAPEGLSSTTTSSSQGQGRRKRERPKDDWERLIEEVRGERPLLGACLELCEHSFDEDRKVLWLQGDPFVRRSLWSARDYLATKAGEAFGKRVRDGISLRITDEMAIEGDAGTFGAVRVAERRGKQRSRPESGEFALAGAGAG